MPKVFPRKSIECNQVAFGIARERTGSTAASFLLHMGFNLTPLTSSILSRS